MKNTIPYILMAFLTFPSPVLADTTASDKALSSYNHKIEIVQSTQDKVNRLKTALKRYYSTNVSKWPTNISDISSVYGGDFDTPVGNINGTQLGAKYTISINLTNSDATLTSLLKTMAERNNGVLNGSVLSFNLDPDKSIAAMESSLSRYIDPTGELNKMYTDINVNSQGVENLNTISAVSAQLDIGNITATNISSESVVSKSISGENAVTNDVVSNLIVTSNNLTNSTVDDLVVSNTNSVTNAAVINALAGIDVNGQMITDSSGRMYTNGEDLNTRFLGIDETANNSLKLGGVDSSLYVRKDKTNYFTTVQKFNGGVKASTVNTSSLATNNLNLSNRFKTNTGTVGNIRVGNSWFSGTKNRSHTNESEIRKLENISAIRKVGKWRYQGEFRKGSNNAYPGATCLNLNAWGYYTGVEKVRECWTKPGGKDDRPERVCEDVAKTVTKSYICR